MIRLRPASAELLALIQRKPIPANLCDLRAKNELIRNGFITRRPVETNTLLKAGGVKFIRQELWITQEGSEWLSQRAATMNTLESLPDGNSENDGTNAR